MYNMNRDRTTRRLVHSLLVTVTFAYARGRTDVVLGGRGGEGDTSTPAGGREGTGILYMPNLARFIFLESKGVYACLIQPYFIHPRYHE